MRDPWLGEPAISERDDPLPRRPVLLTAPPQRAGPEADYVVPERPQGVGIGRYGMIGKEPAHHLP
jgi:hypothetical protein